MTFVGLPNIVWEEKKRGNSVAKWFRVLALCDWSPKFVCLSLYVCFMVDGCIRVLAGFFFKKGRFISITIIPVGVHYILGKWHFFYCHVNAIMIYINTWIIEFHTTQLSNMKATAVTTIFILFFASRTVSKHSQRFNNIKLQI